MTSAITLKPSQFQSAAIDGSLIRPSKFAHCVIRSRRFAKTVAWYKTVLHATASHESDKIAFLTFDDEHHRVAIASHPDFKNHELGVAGFDHVAFAYSSLSDLFLTYERLALAGIEPYWAVNHGPTTSLYYRDPDGNRIELQTDNFDTTEDSYRYMASPAYAENTTRVDLDPEEFLRRLRLGELETVLKTRPDIGPRHPSTAPTGISLIPTD